VAANCGRELHSAALDPRKERRRQHRTRRTRERDLVEQVVADKGADPRIARLATEVFAPVVLIVVVTLIVCLHAAGLSRGLGLAFVAMVLAGGVPYGAILLGVRRGVLADHHVSRREQRRKILAIGVVSAAVGLVVLSWVQAPRAIFALLAARRVVHAAPPVRQGELPLRPRRAPREPRAGLPGRRANPRR